MLPVKEKVLAQLTYFTEYCDEEVRLKAVSGLGMYVRRCAHTHTQRERVEEMQSSLSEGHCIVVCCFFCNSLQLHHV